MQLAGIQPASGNMRPQLGERPCLKRSTWRMIGRVPYPLLAFVYLHIHVYVSSRRDKYIQVIFKRNIKKRILIHCITFLSRNVD